MTIPDLPPALEGGRRPSFGAWLLFVVIWLCLSGTAASTGQWWWLLAGPFFSGLMFAITKPRAHEQKHNKRIF